MNFQNFVVIFCNLFFNFKEFHLNKFIFFLYANFLPTNNNKKMKIATLAFSNLIFSRREGCLTN